MGVRREARAALAAAGLRPRRRWGQHFLCDGGVARRIVETAGVTDASCVLEIGPGLGALTDLLAARVRRLQLIEVDPNLAGRLAARYAAMPHVHVMQADVLAQPLDTLVSETGVTVVANLPYNIATEVVFRLLAHRVQFPRAVLMVQREVAERLAARPGTSAWGIVSVVVQAFADVRIAFGVSPRSFLPPPKVHSAVVEIGWSPAARIPIGDADVFRRVVRAAFGQRRKMLRNALGVLGSPAQVEAACAAAGIDTRVRAETLDLDAFGRLARAFDA